MYYAQLTTVGFLNLLSHESLHVYNRTSFAQIHGLP